MGIGLSNKSTITKVLNNNIILVKDNGVEKILFSKGIGFNKKYGEIIESGIEVDKIFTIENEQNQENFKEVFERIDNNFIALCEEAIKDISEEISGELNEAIHIGLIDHLFMAIRRLKKGDIIENPFLVEIETLYPREFELAQKVADKIEDAYKIKFPDDEIGFITLHIHSAKNNGKLSNTIKYSYLSSSIVEHVEDRLEIEIDKKSLDYARFLTHIRFAIERIVTDKRLKNELTSVIKETYPLAYDIAGDVSKIIGQELKQDITDDEIAYLAMHIERFRVSFNIE